MEVEIERLLMMVDSVEWRLVFRHSDYCARDREFLEVRLRVEPH